MRQPDKRKANSRTIGGAGNLSLVNGSGANTPPTEAWHLRLYVAGQTPRSLTAFANLTEMCERYLRGRYRIEVIDLSKQPQLAQQDDIVALPTLIRMLPVPLRRVIGDLSDSGKVMVSLELCPGTL